MFFFKKNKLDHKKSTSKVSKTLFAVFKISAVILVSVN